MQLNSKGVKEVRRLRQKGLSFREIAKLLNKDLKTVYRWHQYGVAIDNGTIPTPSK